MNFKLRKYTRCSLCKWGSQVAQTAQLHSGTVKVLLHTLFGGALALSLSAYFEQCLDNNVPVWSTLFGCPVLHHGYYGFILAVAAYVGLTVIYERRTV